MTDPRLSLTETPEKVRNISGVASEYRKLVSEIRAKYTKDEKVDDEDKKGKWKETKKGEVKGSHKTLEEVELDDPKPNPSLT